MTRYLLVEFETPKEALEATRKSAEAGLPADDLLSPQPVEGAHELLVKSRPPPPVGWVMVAAGFFGAALGYGMQWYSAVYDYPINSGGRPLNSWPVFLLVPFEMAILLAGICGFVFWLWACGLPRLNHPLFAAEICERATRDRYVLVFKRDAETIARLRALLAPLRPRFSEVPA
jgi:hypothetical protein